MIHCIREALKAHASRLVRSVRALSVSVIGYHYRLGAYQKDSAALLMPESLFNSHG